MNPLQWAPRVIHIPLSGGDRKSLAKQLRYARQTYDAQMKRAAEAQRIADIKLAEARLARCRAWNAAMFMGGPAQPSPSIEDAIVSGFDLIEVRCNQCRRIKRIPLASIRRAPSTPLHILESSFGCEPCYATTRWKPRAHIIGLRSSTPYLTTTHRQPHDETGQSIRLACERCASPLEIANGVETGDGRIYVEKVNIVFPRKGGAPDEYLAF